jgi:hypothetical protein
MRHHFDEMMESGVEGMMISPGYPYEKAPDQEHFLHRNQTQALFRRLLAGPTGGWRFNQTPLFLEFLQGKYELNCTPWGNPTFNVFGWQKPCYLLGEGYCETFTELLETADWDGYGHTSGNAKCCDCMVHSGYEPSAVEATFGSLRGFLTTCRLVLFPNKAAVPDEPRDDDFGDISSDVNEPTKGHSPADSGDYVHLPVLN